ncbi:sugar phosphate nucleotidyltransferase [Streptomyces uncialis]|uniref:sugar phosphate nucleotidyltransferase n=1 Tax=Streptomyces uncialis TaxID=1048205 RepID=UPI002E30C5B0|nr:sugar phosphate nucleotidyltransferase [Streptomyces uncialis]
MRAIILTGGKGTRLRPYTENRPKGLLQLSRYSILEVIIRRLRGAGFSHITLCVSHLADQIRAEFGDGATLGVRIDYSTDPRPLGTAAPLAQVADFNEPALVMNGDVLTALDFAELYRVHKDSGGVLTVASFRRPMPIGFGVLDIRGDQVAGIWEKPTLHLDISAGIYVADPAVLEAITPGKVVDMPDLVGSMMESGRRVHAYSFSDRWHDIGTPERYEEAQRCFAENPDLYLRNTRTPDRSTPEDRPEGARPPELRLYPSDTSREANGSVTNDDPATNDLPSQIAQDMGTVLECRPLGPADDFFLLGGDSLRAVELIARLTERFEPDDAVAADRLHAELLLAVFDDASPDALADVVRSHHAASRSGR